MNFHKKSLVVAMEAALLLGFAPYAHAANEQLPEVKVTAEELKPLPAAEKTGLDKNSLFRLRSQTSDTAKMLDGQPGVSLNAGGGVSSLPALHGMADDRVRIKVDGMDLISACANHMNPALSYIDPTNVASIKVLPGITPVSMGGDSIAGTIQVDSAAPEFAEAGGAPLIKGQIGGFYRSNNQARGLNATTTFANDTVSLRYSGSTVTAKNYKAGGDFKTGANPGIAGIYVAPNEVGSSAYQVDNQAMNFGVRRGNHLFDLKLGLQNIPYQGFPNQYMDMLWNSSRQVNLKYTGQYDWGQLQGRVYNEKTRHYMNFLTAKTSAMSTAGMPMDTDGSNTGAELKGDITLSDTDTLRVGMDYQRYRLNDWWSPVGMYMPMMGAMMNMMTGGNFQNINNGQRDRYAAFAEWESRASQEWTHQVGLRLENVSMDTGTVQGYNTLAYPAANYATFNNSSRKRSDNNIDFTALSRYTPSNEQTFEFGVSQKTRSPSLYERYTWSTDNTMAMHMNNWYGDGNGYVGDMNLKPEVARTASGSLSWHDAEPNGFEVKVAPYYTQVQNYIDAERCPVGAMSMTCTAANLTAATGFVNLHLVNQTARLYGADASARFPMLRDGDMGDVNFTGVINYVNGKNTTTGDNLYHIMPLNAKLAIEQHMGGWTNAIEARLVSAKTNVSATRNELKTSGYGLLGLRTSYDTKQFRVDLSVDNLMNKFYNDPMGGAYLGQRPMTYGTPVPGMGRSINAGLTLKF